MSKLRTPRWTLVQHSAYAAHQDAVFRDAVEPAGLSTHRQLGEVVDAGGLLFDDYAKAEDAAEAVSQPAMDRALYPDRVMRADVQTGLSFDETLTFGGRRLYLPPNEATAR